MLNFKEFISKSKTALCLVALLSLSLMTRAQHNELSSRLSQSIEGKKAQIGIAVIIDGKDTITINNSNRYPMCSVFKFHQALAVMDYLNQHNLPLDTKVPIRASDLKENTYSPLRDKYPNGNIEMSIADLLKYTLQLSDNNACDILFDYAGGTQHADRYIRSLGIQDFAIVATEDEMHQDLQKGYANWTSPLATAKLLEVFLNKPLFDENLQSFVKQTMIECQTGKDRLPLPLVNTQAIIGHKTGSGDINAQGQLTGTNDAGFVILPDGRHYTIAVFVKDSEESSQDSGAIIAEVSRIVYEYMTGK